VLTEISDNSGYAVITPLQHRSELGDALKKRSLRWRRQLGKLKIVRTDRGAEYVSFDRWCGSEGILCERTVAYTPRKMAVLNDSTEG
jgi:hypothetical protein